MIPHARAKLVAAIVVASLALNVVFISCAADSTAPQSTAAQSTGSDQSTAILAKLDVISARLDSIETAMAKQSDTVTKSLGQLATAIGASTNSSGGSALPARTISQVDSIVALASYLADNAYTPSVQFCLNLAVGAKGELAIKSTVEGEAAADAGAWAGIGAFAGGEAKAAGKLAAASSLASRAPCRDAYPKARFPSRNAAADQAPTPLKTAIANLKSSLNWGDDPVSSRATDLTSLVGSGSPQMSRVVAALPVPPALQSAFNDPQGYVAAQLPEKVSTAMSNLCNRAWNAPAVSTSITYACGRISSGSTNIGDMFGMLNNFPAVQTASNLATTAIAGICSRVNTIGTKTLTITNPLSIGPTNLYNARLFPTYTEPAGC